MSKLKFVPHVLSEHLFGPNFDRQPEPDLVMDRDDQVAGYVEAGNENGGMYVVHLFHAAHMTQTIEGAARVLDLACGPATQLLLTARYHPDTEFVGVDLSAGMLDAARAQAADLGLRNVSFRQMDITDLSAIKQGEFQAVTSTMALHHLPTLDHLTRCFQQVATVLPPGGSVYLGDLLRLKRRRTVAFMAANSADNQPKVFNDDFRNSMLAAFSRLDFEELRQRYLPGCRAFSARPLALFHLIKTDGRPLAPARKAVFTAARERLPSRLKGDLDDLRMFFRMGGLSTDPFAA